jgi:hypothetical protein
VRLTLKWWAATLVASLLILVPLAIIVAAGATFAGRMPQGWRAYAESVWPRSRALTDYEAEILDELDARGGSGDVAARDPRSARDAEAFTAAVDALRERGLVEGARTLPNVRFADGYYQALRARITDAGRRALAARG